MTPRPAVKFAQRRILCSPREIMWHFCRNETFARRFRGDQR